MARWVFGLFFYATTLAGWAQKVEIVRAPGQPRLVVEKKDLADLSGITWLGGDTFAAVSDKRNIIQYLKLQIDPGTGALTGGAWGDVVEVPTKAGDFEGVVYLASDKRFYISTEKSHEIIVFSPGARSARSLDLPKIYRKARRNMSLEALTWSDSLRRFWFANEEALEPDGAVSEAATGTLVRLQQLDAKERPLVQHAWRTEPSPMRYGNAGSGIADLCLLPTGDLIVLERGFGEGGLHLRLFLADFEGATDTSKLPALAEAAIVVAKKTLLFEEATFFTNYEGITLGPKLADGWQSLILVADSNGSSMHTFLALKVRIAPRAE